MGKGGMILLFLLIISVFILTSVNAVTRTCYSCGNCTAEIGNASVADIIQLNNSISNIGPSSCINFSSMDNVTFDCQTFSNYIIGDGTGYGIDLNAGFVISRMANNNIIKNCNISRFNRGIFAMTSSGNNYTNLITNFNTDGILLSVASNNTLNNLIFYNNSDAGLSISGTTGFNNLVANVTATYNYIGISLDSATNIVLRNITANFNNYGMATGSCINETIINSTVNNNTYYGIEIFQANMVNLTNVITQENGQYDIPFSINTNSPQMCANVSFTNVTGSGNRPIEYYNSSIVMQNRTLSELILCNADFSSLNNITIQGSDSFRNNQLSLWGVDNSNFSNINSSNNYFGIQAYAINNNSFFNITTNYNVLGYYIYFAVNNTFSNINSNNNNVSFDMSYLTNSTMNNVTSNYNNISLLFDSNNNYDVFNNVISNNNTYYGADILLSLNNKFMNSRFQENGLYDVYTDTIEYQSSSCGSNFTNVTGSGNRPIEYYNSSVVLQNRTLSELILCGSTGSNLNNITIQGSDSLQNNLLFIIGVNNSNFTNINSSNNYYGIYLEYLSNNNNFLNLTLNNNSQYGLNLYYSSNNSFNNVNANSNSYGIYIGTVYFGTGSQNNSFINIIANSNSQNGLTFYKDSIFNKINNSYIQNNGVYGIYFLHNPDYPSSLPSNNTFYNNYISNTNNYYTSTTIADLFNTTKASATNIINGSSIGGNYWANPTGGGFSQTCDDGNGDGICDSAYNLVSLGYDYLSLTCMENWTCSDWGVCSGGIQTKTCTDSNSCGTTRTKPITTAFCGGGGNSGGGGGSSPITQASVSQSFSTATPSQPIIILINNTNIDLLKISITSNQDVVNVSITIKNVEVNSSEVQIQASGLNYQAFQISTEGLNYTNTANASIDFKVNKTWLQQRGLTYSDVQLLRKPNNSTDWSTLNTSLVSQDINYYYFTSLSPGFSTFLVFISKAACIPAEKRCFNNQVQFCLGNSTWFVQDKCEYWCRNAECVKSIAGIDISIAFYGVMIFISSGIILVVFFIFRNISRSR